jgi:hypothetical protein
LKKVFTKTGKQIGNPLSKLEGIHLRTFAKER